MKLRQLQFVQAVVEHGSFSRAAELCHATQPTLSNAIAQLETELGGKLFTRTTRRVDLTPFGAYLMPDLTAVLEARDEMRTAEGLIHMASVGRVTEDGGPCRWIEVRFEIKAEKGRVDVMVIKVLVPEKNLAKGQDPLKHAVRAWIKRRPDDPPKELEDPADIDKGPLPLVLAAPMKNQKELEPILVASKAGNLRCKGVEGKVEFQAGGPGRTIQGTVESRLHAKAPFGTVSSLWRLEMHRAGSTKVRKATFDMKLADFGTGAKSEMPEKK